MRRRATRRHGIQGARRKYRPRLATASIRAPVWPRSPFRRLHGMATHPRSFRPVLALAVVILTLLVGRGATAQVRNPIREPAPAGSGCAMLELTLHAPESLTVAVPTPACGAVRVIVVGPVRHLPQPEGSYTPGRGFEVPVVLENAGTRPVRTPLELRIDSVTPVRGGRQLSARYSREFIEHPFQDARGNPQPWRFSPVGAPTGRGEPVPGTLAPGARTAPLSLFFGVHPLTRTVRVWLDVRGHRSPPSPRARRAAPPLQPIPLDAAAERLIVESQLPALRSTQGYRDRAHQLTIFEVSYGSAQDCLSGCFYSRALGLSHRGRAGWLSLDNYEQDDRLRQRLEARRFVPTRADVDRFNAWLLDTLGARFGAYDERVAQLLLPIVLDSPYASRTLLRRHVHRLYADVDQAMATRLVGHPTVQRDVELLTDLALLPSGGYADVRTSARAALRARAPSLVQAPTTSAWTLFVLAQTLAWDGTEAALAAAIANHPNARRNPATLTVLARVRPDLRARAVGAVRASPRVRALLAAKLDRPTAPVTGTGLPGLLADPEIRRSEDALLVLANLSVAWDQELAWAASRLLPESAFRRWDPPYMPMSTMVTR